MRRQLAPATPLEELTEKQYDALLFQTHESVARTLGWQSWHVVRPQGSRAGLPDRICWRDRILFVELKSAAGTLSDVQAAVLTGLAKAGGECYLWAPADYDDATIVLASHGAPRAPIGSRWTADGCRADQLDQLKIA